MFCHRLPRKRRAKLTISLLAKAGESAIAHRPSSLATVWLAGASTSAGDPAQPVKLALPDTPPASNTLPFSHAATRVAPIIACTPCDGGRWIRRTHTIDLHRSRRHAPHTQTTMYRSSPSAFRPGRIANAWLAPVFQPARGPTGRRQRRRRGGYPGFRNLVAAGGSARAASPAPGPARRQSLARPGDAR
jgi:hypothetical protein